MVSVCLAGRHFLMVISWLWYLHIYLYVFFCTYHLVYHKLWPENLIYGEMMYGPLMQMCTAWTLGVWVSSIPGSFCCYLLLLVDYCAAPSTAGNAVSEAAFRQELGEFAGLPQHLTVCSLITTWKLAVLFLAILWSSDIQDSSIHSWTPCQLPAYSQWDCASTAGGLIIRIFGRDFISALIGMWF